MRSQRIAQDQVAELAQRRLRQLSAELAEIRPVPEPLPAPDDEDGSGEPPPKQGPPQAPGRHAHRPVDLSATAAGWMHDRLPATLQGRVAFSPTHLLVVAILLVAAAVVTGVWFTRHQGTDSTIPPAASISTAPSPLVSTGPGSANTAASASGQSRAPSSSASAPSAAGATGPVPGAPPASGGIIVDVTGKVRRPGIATLPAGARVVDALQAAGGARHGVGLGSLNLARVLTDGEQVVVGVPAPHGVAASALATATPGSTGDGGATVPMVDINTGTQADLEQLPGVGPVTARSILDFRAQQGSFTSVDQLLDVSGIGDATLAKISPYCTL